MTLHRREQGTAPTYRRPSRLAKCVNIDVFLRTAIRCECQTYVLQVASPSQKYVKSTLKWITHLLHYATAYSLRHIPLPNGRLSYTLYFSLLSKNNCILLMICIKRKYIGIMYLPLHSYFHFEISLAIYMVLYVFLRALIQILGEFNFNSCLPVSCYATSESSWTSLRKRC